MRVIASLLFPETPNYYPIESNFTVKSDIQTSLLFVYSF